MRMSDCSSDVCSSDLHASVQRERGQAMIVIEDSAPGVSDDKRARLFERFYRVETSRNRASGGSGLGLTICRHIVQAHRGEIRAEASSLGVRKRVVWGKSGSERVELGGGRTIN